MPTSEKLTPTPILSYQEFSLLIQDEQLAVLAKGNERLPVSLCSLMAALATFPVDARESMFQRVAQLFELEVAEFRSRVQPLIEAGFIIVKQPENTERRYTLVESVKTLINNRLQQQHDEQKRG